MPNPEAEWNRWIDDAPASEGEAAAFLRDRVSDPAKLQEKAALQRMAGDLRSALPASLEPPYPSFFNEQIRRRIERETLLETHAPSSRGAAWLSWFTWPKLVPIAASLLLALAALQTVLLPPPHTTATEVVHTYSPQPSLHIESGYSPEANATVLRIEGAETLPEDFDFAAVPSGNSRDSHVEGIQHISRPPVVPVYFFGPESGR